MKKFGNEIKGVVIIVLYMVMQYMVVLLAKALMSKDDIPRMIDGKLNPASDVYLMKAFGLVAVISVFILIYIYRESIKEALKKISQDYKTFFKKLLIYVFITYALLIVFNLVDMIFFSQYASEIGDNEEFLNQVLLKKPSFLLISSIAIWIPIVEEVVFRYALISKLMHRVNKYLAAALATIIFAFIHIGFDQIFSLEIGSTIHLFLTYIPVSLALNFIYVREEDLTFPILIHIFNNSLSVITIFAVYGLVL